jgi:hypothetical protein
MVFQDYSFRRAWKNGLQVFLIGYATLVILMFTWSATSDYGFERTLKDTSLNLLLSPMFWFLPLMMALPIGFMRGITSQEINFSDDESLEYYIENQRWQHQPILIKGGVILAFCALLLVVFLPDSEVSQETVEIMKSKVKNLNCPWLSDEQGDVIVDGKVSSTEFNSVMSSAMHVEIMGCDKPMAKHKGLGRHKYQFEES